MPLTTPTSPMAAPKPVSAWVWAFRCLRWSTYLAALITLILLLHKTPPPRVEVSPQAAARAEQKVEQVQQSVAQGQQATLRLDEPELNSYLASHLALSPGANGLGVFLPRGLLGWGRYGGGGRPVCEARRSHRHGRVYTILALLR
jgi:hypothetical protein